MTDLPDLTVTVPGDLRLPLARLLVREPVPAAFRGIALTTLPSAERLRLAADLRDPDIADGTRYSPAPIEDEPNHPQAVVLTEDEQAVVHGGEDAEVSYVDRDGDRLEVDRWVGAQKEELRFHAVRAHGSSHGNSVLLGLNHQRRLHALLTANLAKHGAL